MAQLRQIQPATSDASGNIAFNFPTTPVNSTWIGTISIPTAPTTAEFSVMVADQNHGSWAATTPFGQITSNGSEQIVVTGTGMTPETQYNAVLLGSILPAGSQQTSPQPVQSKVLVSGIPGAPPVAISGNADQIVKSIPADITPGSTNAFGVYSATDDYETLEVAIGGLSTGPFAVSVQNVTRLIQAPYQTLPAVPISAEARFFFPMGVQVGDEIEVFVLGLSGANWSGTLSLVGHGLFCQPSPLRPDDRLAPLGSLIASAAASSTAETLIAAPGAGLRLLLASLSLNGVGSTAFGSVTATVGGTTTNLGTVGGQSGTGNLIGPQGLLLDADTSVGIAWAAGEVVGNAQYDVVV
jgi:hypothetical protein